MLLWRTQGKKGHGDWRCVKNVQCNALENVRYTFSEYDTPDELSCWDRYAGDEGNNP